MVNFNNYFEDGYQFSLKDISYSRAECSEELTEYDLNISDVIDTEINGNLLNVTFTRNVYFYPEALFKMKVVFDITLHFNSEPDEDTKNINWGKMLFETSNTYLGNVVSRVSHLIAEITASYGQQPLITPPTPILNVETE